MYPEATSISTLSQTTAQKDDESPSLSPAMSQYDESSERNTLSKVSLPPIFSRIGDNNSSARAASVSPQTSPSAIGQQTGSQHQETSPITPSYSDQLASALPLPVHGIAIQTNSSAPFSMQQRSSYSSTASPELTPSTTYPPSYPYNTDSSSTYTPSRTIRVDEPNSHMRMYPLLGIFPSSRLNGEYKPAENWYSPDIPGMAVTGASNMGLEEHHSHSPPSAHSPTGYSFPGAVNSDGAGVTSMTGEGLEHGGSLEDGAGMLTSVLTGGTSPSRRGVQFPKQVTETLRTWLMRHADHPYPTEEEKNMLANLTGLSMIQVCNWMINARRRILMPAKKQAAAAAQAAATASRTTLRRHQHQHHGYNYSAYHRHPSSDQHQSHQRSQQYSPYPHPAHYPSAGGPSTGPNSVPPPSHHRSSHRNMIPRHSPAFPPESGPYPAGSSSFSMDMISPFPTSSSSSSSPVAHHTNIGANANANATAAAVAHAARYHVAANTPYATQHQQSSSPPHHYSSPAPLMDMERPGKLAHGGYHAPSRHHQYMHHSL